MLITYIQENAIPETSSREMVPACYQFSSSEITSIREINMTDENRLK